MSWEAFVRDTIGTDQQKQAADRAGIDQSAISRWLKTGKPGTAENVAAFARGYNRPVLEAFVAAGFLTGKEAKVRPAGRPDFSQLSNDELLELVRARMEERGEHGGDTAATSGGERAVADVLAAQAEAGMHVVTNDDLDELDPESDEDPPTQGGRQMPAAARRSRKRP